MYNTSIQYMFINTPGFVIFNFDKLVLESKRFKLIFSMGRFSLCTYIYILTLQ